MERALTSSFPVPSGHDVIITFHIFYLKLVVVAVVVVVMVAVVVVVVVAFAVVVAVVVVVSKVHSDEVGAFKCYRRLEEDHQPTARIQIKVKNETLLGYTHKSFFVF